ncbi:MAG: CDP-alcohol phosphatidyltransferase family protein [Omnitrophica WOR_2 bacterium]
MQDIRDHKRVNDIFFGPLERPALRWLAEHLPVWATPDMLTAVGVFGAIVTVAGYIASNFSPWFLWLASFGYVINWFGDSLDGNLARHRHIEKPRYGFFIDHTLDAVVEIIIFIGLGLSPYVRFDLALLGCITYLLMSVLVYIRTALVGEFQISYGKLGPTEIRAIAIGLNTLMFIFGPRTLTILPGLTSYVISPYDVILIGIILLLAWFIFSSWLKQAKELAKLGE